MRLLSRGVSSSGRSGRKGAPTTSRAPRAVSTKAVRRRSSVRSTVLEKGRAMSGLCHGERVTPVACVNVALPIVCVLSLQHAVAKGTDKCFYRVHDAMLCRDLEGGTEVP